MSYSGQRMETTGATPASAAAGQAEQDRRALQLMLEYACTETRADGCAATLNCGATILQAGVGLGGHAANLPEAVAAIREECLRSGQVVDCQDTASDPRTDAESCRTAGIGACVAVPVRVAGKTVGVVEVHSAQAYNFMEGDVETVQRVADVIAALVWRKGTT
jgi:GAF domain-containing protein